MGLVQAYMHFVLADCHSYSYSTGFHPEIIIPFEVDVVGLEIINDDLVS